MRVRGLLLALLLLGLPMATQAQGNWEPLDEGDGYRSSLGVIQAQSEPQPAGAVLNTAQAFGGIPYKWAGTSPESGFDCSGYIYEVLRLNGYQVPRMADQQFYETERVAYEELLPGDLVFFTTYLPGPSHAGFYLGDGYFIHASSAGEIVLVSEMETGYYRERFLGGGRPDGWIPSEQSDSVLVSSASPELEVEVEPEAPPVIDVEPGVVSFRPDIRAVRSRPPAPEETAPESENPADEATLKLELLLGELVAVGTIQVDEFRQGLSTVLGGVVQSFKGLNQPME